MKLICGLGTRHVCYYCVFFALKYNLIACANAVALQLEEFRRQRALSQQQADEVTFGAKTSTHQNLRDTKNEPIEGRGSSHAKLAQSSHDEANGLAIGIPEESARQAHGSWSSRNGDAVEGENPKTSTAMNTEKYAFNHTALETMHTMESISESSLNQTSLPLSGVEPTKPDLAREIGEKSMLNRIRNAEYTDPTTSDRIGRPVHKENGSVGDSVTSMAEGASSRFSWCEPQQGRQVDVPDTTAGMARAIELSRKAEVAGPRTVDEPERAADDLGAQASLSGHRPDAVRDEGVSFTSMDHDGTQSSDQAIFDKFKERSDGVQASSTPRLSLSASSGAIALWWMEHGSNEESAMHRNGKRNQSNSSFSSIVGKRSGSQSNDSVSERRTISGNVRDAARIHVNADDRRKSSSVQDQKPGESGRGELKPPSINAPSDADGAMVESHGSTAVEDAKDRGQQEFLDLRTHIDELTEEKYALQRCLEQQTTVADRLADENESLTKRLNQVAASHEAAAREIEARQQEVLRARDAVAEAVAERDAYEMSAREATERVRSLAEEVIELEERLLKATSETLKFKSKCEEMESTISSPSIKDSSRSSAAHRMSVDAGGYSGMNNDAAGVVNALRNQVENLIKERESLKEHVSILEQALSGKREENGNERERYGRDTQRLDPVKPYGKIESMTARQKLAEGTDNEHTKDLHHALDILIGHGVPHSVAFSLAAIVQSKCGGPHSEDQSGCRNENEAPSEQTDVRIFPTRGEDVQELTREGTSGDGGNDAAPSHYDDKVAMEYTKRNDCQGMISPEIRALFPVQETVWPFTDAWSDLDPSIDQIVDGIYQALDCLEKQADGATNQGKLTTIVT